LKQKFETHSMPKMCFQTKKPETHLRSPRFIILVLLFKTANLNTTAAVLLSGMKITQAQSMPARTMMH